MGGATAVRPNWIALARAGVGLLSVLLLLFGLNEARLQRAESTYLSDVAATIRTGQASADIEAAVSYTYRNAYLGRGRRGPLRASALETLDPRIGGQCGEFSRLAINVLSAMGYPARRVYLFPSPAAAGAFNPRVQRSYHVMGEVWIDGRWVAVDPLRGITFRHPDGRFVTLAELATTPAPIDLAYKSRPVETHRTVRGRVIERPLDVSMAYYRHPEWINWSRIARVPFAFRVLWPWLGHRDRVHVPLVLEQPHRLRAIVALAAGLALGLACLVRGRPRALRSAGKPGVA